MIEEIHWTVRVVTLAWSVLFTGHTPTPARPQAHAECASATDCTIVRDACGRPYGRPLTNPMAPPAPQLCPPVNYAVTEPICDAGRCDAASASTPRLRGCSLDADCVTMEWVCGGWWAVASAQRSAAQQHVNQVARARSCRAQTPSVAPPPACLGGICVVRAASFYSASPLQAPASVRLSPPRNKPAL
jgi:hypothetical protein